MIIADIVNKLWNVHTRCPRLTEDLQQINDARNTAVINKELARLNIDITCLQETCLADSGSIRESKHTFFWQHLAQDQPRQHGVGFAVKNLLTAAIENLSGGSEKIRTVRMSPLSGLVTVISAYAPTLNSMPEAKAQIYEALDATLSRIPSAESMYRLGDFNTRVGSDRNSWPTCLRHHGIGRVNENSQIAWRSTKFLGGTHSLTTGTSLTLSWPGAATWAASPSH